MTIVFVNRFCYPDHSATSQIVSDLAASLAASGLSVVLVASRLSYDNTSAQLPAREQWNGINIHRVWTSGFGRAHLLGRLLDYMTFYLSLPWTLWRILRRGDVVIAKTDPPLISLLVAPIAWLRGAVLVNWLQDVFPELAVAMGEPKIPRLLTRILQTLRNKSLRLAAMNVVIGERMSEYFHTQGISAKHLRVIPNWAHEADISPMPSSQSQLRQSLKLTDKFVVGYSGNLGRAHDPETIFDAAWQLRDASHIIFLITGGGHGYEQLRLRASRAGLLTILFQPYQPIEKLSDSMAAADLHLLSLRPELEGHIVPSKFYGIAAAARPMAFIGDEDGELARLIAAHGCGFSIEQGRADLLASRILELANDVDSCQRYGLAARQLLMDKFSRAQAHKQWHDLLQDLNDNKFSDKKLLHQSKGHET